MQNLEPILIFITVAEIGDSPTRPIAWASRGRDSMAVRKLEKMSVSGSCTGRRAACS